MLDTSSLQVMGQLEAGPSTIKKVAVALQRSKQQVYRIVHQLQQENLVVLQRGIISPTKTPFTNLLLRLLTTYPNSIAFLSGSGGKVLSACREPQSVSGLCRKTGLRKSRIYQLLITARKNGVLLKANGKYLLNKKIWPELEELLLEFQLREETVDGRIPPDALVYHKTKTEIIFSTSISVDAVKTAFSAYSQFGIKLLLPREYYVLPRRKLSKRQVFLHSLYVVEKEKNIRNLLYLAVFYQKFRRELIFITHPLVEDIHKILTGKTLPGYPTLEEIKEKLVIYTP